MKREFHEIGHSGGKITFTFRKDESGRVQFNIQVSFNRPVPTTWIAMYALPQGLVVESIKLGGIGTPWNPPPIPGCIPVFMGSDTEEKFGHDCPACGGYWRSGPWPRICPYCGTNAHPHGFLSKAQQMYVQHYCSILQDDSNQTENNQVVIDMDVVADAVGKEGEKPPFYISNESQQCKFNCTACGEFNDVLGRFAYCSSCGTRNDLADFESNTVSTIRTRLNTGVSPEACLRDAVAAFDTLTAQYAKQLASRVPMTKARRARLEKRSFHDFKEVCALFKEWFDIDLVSGVKEDERRRIFLAFLRRHLHEHNGSEVDEKYLSDSGDTSVKLKQQLYETQEEVHLLLGFLQKVARNLHAGFHELLPTVEANTIS